MSDRRTINNTNATPIRMAKPMASPKSRRIDTRGSGSDCQIHFQKKVTSSAARLKNGPYGMYVRLNNNFATKATMIPQNGASTNTISTGCQPRKAPIMAIKVTSPKPIASWPRIRDEIHRQVCEQGYNARKKAFTQFYGSDQLDASLLMMPLVGFLPPTDPRVIGTVQAIERELLRDGFVLRYRTEGDGDGLPPGEGAFSWCRALSNGPPHPNPQRERGRCGSATAGPHNSQSNPRRARTSSAVQPASRRSASDSDPRDLASFLPSASSSSSWKL